MLWHSFFVFLTKPTKRPSLWFSAPSPLVPSEDKSFKTALKCIVEFF